MPLDFPMRTAPEVTKYWQRLRAAYLARREFAHSDLELMHRALLPKYGKGNYRVQGSIIEARVSEGGRIVWMPIGPLHASHTRVWLQACIDTGGTIHG